MWRNVVFCNLVLLFACTALFAQNEQYQFSQLNITNGLSHNQVTCIYKDKNGFMWFGTLSGLNRFDGYKFKIFKHDNHDLASLDDDFIVNVYEGPFHKLWIQTHYGLNIYNEATEHFEHDAQNELANFNIPDSLIKSIKEDRFGNFLFVHRSLGIFKYNPATKKTSRYAHTKADTTSIFFEQNS